MSLLADIAARIVAAFWVVLLAVAFACSLAGCATETHNRHGGYIDACGDKPPLLGDDC